MLSGDRVRVRPFREDELSMVEGWYEDRERGIGPWQPYVPGHGAYIRAALSGNLEPAAERGFLAIERLGDAPSVIGFVRYGVQKVVPGMVEFYDIGYGITDLESRGKGYAHEACALVVDHLFATQPEIQRVGAFTAALNEPSIRMLDRLGFVHEGTIRRAVFFDDRWHDIALYAVLREEWEALHG